MNGAGVHFGELALRRWRAGEPVSGVDAHAPTCAECRARLKGLEDEQRRFEEAISFDRFAAGVERAARGDRKPQRARGPVRAWMAAPVLAMAAAVAVMVTFGPRGGSNRTKGGAGITVRVAAGTAGPQRTAAVEAPEALSPGERVRIGYQPGSHRYLLSLSIDDHGQVTPLYPEAGRSVAVARAGTEAAATRYLPDSVEFTDTGAERLIVILSDQPLEVEAARRAARAAYDKVSGDILHLPSLDLPGEQFHRTFIKP